MRTIRITNQAECVHQSASSYWRMRFSQSEIPGPPQNQRSKSTRFSVLQRNTYRVLFRMCNGRTHP